MVPVALFLAQRARKCALRVIFNCFVCAIYHNASMLLSLPFLSNSLPTMTFHRTN